MRAVMTPTYPEIKNHLIDPLTFVFSLQVQAPVITLRNTIYADAPEINSQDLQRASRRQWWPWVLKCPGIDGRWYAARLRPSGESLHIGNTDGIERGGYGRKT